MRGSRSTVGRGWGRAAHEHADADGGFVGGPVDGGSACVVLGDRAFDDAVFRANPPGGQKVSQDVTADGADEINVGAGDDVGGQDELVPGGGEGGGEAGPVRVGARDAVGGVGHRGPQCLVGGQQGPDLLLDAVGGAGPQDVPAQDRGLQLRVGGFDLPAFVVEPDEFTGRVSGGIGEGGQQPVVARARALGGADGDLGLDGTHGQWTDPGQDRAVTAAGHRGQLPVRLAAHEQIGAGGGQLVQQGGGGEVPVAQQHPSPKVHRQAAGVLQLTGRGRAEHGPDQRPGPAGHQRGQT